MLNKLSIFLLALGLLVSLLGIAVDYLLPGTSPGLNLPQFLVMALGLALVFAAWRLRRARTRLRTRGGKARAFAIALMLALITLFALEFVLTIWGMPTYFPSEIPDRNVKVSNWRICDELGCRPGTQATRRGCADGTIVGRPCIVNQQGFADSEDFVVEDDFDKRTRIILMGDSHGQGYSADIGKSYAEHLEAVFPDFIVWNTAISGNGTRHAVAAFRAFAPELRPHLAILNFTMNDFRDNLLPHDDRLVLQDSGGALHFVRRFRFDRRGNPVDLPADMVHAYLAAGYKPPTSELERVTGLTRLGTLFLRLLDSFGMVYIDESLENQRLLARQYLRNLRDGARELDSTFLVLLVPRLANFDEPSDMYLLATQLMMELEIPYLDPRVLLDPVEDYVPHPDGHWSNSGHLKIGEVLAECIQSFVASGSLENCEHAVLPTPSNAD